VSGSIRQRTRWLTRSLAHTGTTPLPRRLKGRGVCSHAYGRFGISQGTLRIYAEKGMIPVIKLPSGHRRFRPADVERLRREWGIDESDSTKERDA
jgi:hypothetical protein